MAAPGLGTVLGGFLLVGVPFAFVGAVFLKRGVARVRERQELQATEMDTVSSVQSGQRAKLVGRAEATESAEPFEGGFSGEPALAARYIVIEARPDGDGGTDERQVYESSVAVACDLTDDTGTVVVDPGPETVEASGDHYESIRVGKGDEPPATVKRFIEATPDLGDVFRGADVGPFNFGGRVRYYREWRIAPGDEVLVYGVGDRDPEADWGESLVVRTDEADDGLFTNYSTEEYANKSLLGIVGYLVGGGALFVGPFAVLAYLLLDMGVV